MSQSAPPDARASAGPSPLSVELNGVATIAEDERRGRPRDLFWPWFASNVSVLGVGYGAFVLDSGISFWQAVAVSVAGITASFALCGLAAVAGKRGSAPTMTLSRAAFGVRGNRLPAVVSWLLTAGWETALAALAVLATSTVLARLGAGGGTGTELVALVVVIGLVAGGGTLGFHLIMRLQVWITAITGALTVLYVVLAAPHVHWAVLSALPAGGAPAVLGAFCLVMTGFGLGWVNAAADYSRYLPRTASSGGVVWWTAFGSSLGPVVLVVFGLLVAGSSPHLRTAIGADPIGALTTVLPTWVLVPFVVVAVLGLVGGAVMDVYSSGLALLAAGLPVPRPVAALVDSVIMLVGSVYVVFFATGFIGPFEGFLITLGVPIAAWAGVFLADLALRRRDYSDADLLDPAGRYGDVRWTPIALVVVATAVGWGLVTNASAGWLDWQGYLLAPLGLGGRGGAWAYANLGVLAALVLGFAGALALTRGAVRTQEAAGGVLAGDRG